MIGIVTSANATDLATTSAPVPRAIGASWLQPPSSWSDACADKRRVFVCRDDALPNHCAIHETRHRASSQLACTLVYFRALNICHNGGILRSFGWARPSGFLFSRGMAHGDLSFLFTRLAAARSFSNSFFSFIVVSFVQCLGMTRM